MGAVREAFRQAGIQSVKDIAPYRNRGAGAVKPAQTAGIPQSYSDVIRVRRCYQSGSEAETAMQVGMAMITRAYRLGKISWEQAHKLAQAL